MDVWIYPHKENSWVVTEGKKGDELTCDVVWLETTAHLTSDGRIHCIHAYAEFEDGPGKQRFCTVRRGRQ